MNIIRFALGQLQTNCYFAVQDKDCLIIDPGDSADFLLEELQRRSLTPQGIIATHGHFDHIMAVGEIQLSFKVPLYLSSRDLFLVKRLSQTAQHFLGYEPGVIAPNVGTGRDLSLQSGPIRIGDFYFEIIHTPGHTPGSHSIYFKEEGVVFTGDTLFKNGIGDYSHSYSSLKDLRSSLAILFTLPGETIVYPGHGEETLIEDEQVGSQ